MSKLAPDWKPVDRNDTKNSFMAIITILQEKLNETDAMFLEQSEIAKESERSMKETQSKIRTKLQCLDIATKTAEEQLYDAKSSLRERVLEQIQQMKANPALFDDQYARDCLEEYERVFTRAERDISNLAEEFSKEAQKFSIGKGDEEKIEAIVAKMEELDAKQHKILSLFTKMFCKDGN